MIISKYALMGRAMHTRILSPIIRACIFSLHSIYLFFAASFNYQFSHYNTQRKKTKTESSDFQVLESYDNNIDRANIKIVYKLQNGQEEG